MAATYEQLMAKSRELFAAGDVAGAKRVARIALDRRGAESAPAPQGGQEVSPTGSADDGGWLASLGGVGNQILAGANEGLANLAGAPVDLATGAINLGISGVNAATGSDFAPITDPVGGSEDMRALMSPFITAGAPDNAPERYARSVGRDVGSAVIPVGATLGTATKATPQIVAALQSAIGSGIASQAARDAAPDSPVLEILAGLAGGALPLALHRAPVPRVPTGDDLGQQAGALYERGATRTPADAPDVADLRATMADALRGSSRVTPAGRVMASGNVKSFLDVLDDYDGHGMAPGEMQNLRTYLQDAAASTDAGERRMATILLDRFDEWRNKRVPEFADADALYARAKRAEDVDWRVEKAARRADSTGTGGNAVNTARQNIRQILDNPKARRGYSPAEIAMMEGIVRGTPMTNAARMIGRLSPTSGALPLMGNIAGIGISPVVGVPLMGAAAGAKGIAELLTNRQIGALSEMIRNGGPVARPGMTAAQDAIVRALMGNTLTGAAGD
jgi:hypothetical protein